jgi:ABC-2 type transport system permease protein
VGTYLAVAAGGFRRYSTYRAATFAGVFTNSVFGCIICFTYLALWDERPDLGGWDGQDAVTFVWLGQSLLMTVAVFTWGFTDEMAERIRSGDIAVDLYRPIDLQGWRYAEDLGRALFHLLGRGVVPTVIGALLFDLVWPDHAATWLWFLVSVLLAVTVSFAIRYLIGLAAFWVLDVRGFSFVVGFLQLFCSGLVLPLVAFPDTLEAVVRVLPFAALIQVPAEVFLEKHTGTGVALALASQLGWAVLLLTAGRVLTRVATRRLVVQGG